MAVNRNIYQTGRRIERRSGKLDGVLALLGLIAIGVIYGLIEHFV